MSDEDDTPIVLHGPGLEELPDGTWQLLVECPTIVHYITLPKALKAGGRVLHLCGFKSDEQQAMYRTAWDTIEDAMRHLL